MSGPILVFGAAGQVGQELMAAARDRGVEARGVARLEADVTDADAVGRGVRDASPRLVVNCAAYTAVDRAEGEPDLAFAVNAAGAGIVAAAAAAAGAAVLHLSTDYVFDGSKPGAYTEDDPLAPLGAYGRGKAEGEARVRAANARHVILRTAWVYGVFGQNFLKTMLRLARERDALRVVADQRGCPTSTRDIADAILAVDRRLSAGTDLTAFGTFHFAGPGATTWHGFAQAVVDAQAPFTGRRPPVEPIPTSAYPTPARRPVNSELDSSRFAQAFGLRAAPWRDRTREAVKILLDPDRANSEAPHP